MRPIVIGNDDNRNKWLWVPLRGYALRHSPLPTSRITSRHWGCSVETSLLELSNCSLGENRHGIVKLAIAIQQQLNGLSDAACETAREFKSQSLELLTRDSVRKAVHYGAIDIVDFQIGDMAADVFDVFHNGCIGGEYVVGLTLLGLPPEIGRAHGR